MRRVVPEFDFLGLHLFASVSLIDGVGEGMGVGGRTEV